MTEDNTVQKIKRWKPNMSKRPIGIPKMRWEDDVLGDVRSMDVRNWKKVAQTIDSRKRVVERARTLYRLQRFGRRLCYKPEGRGADFRFCYWNFSLT
jgi:hypothetical protein